MTVKHKTRDKLLLALGLMLFVGILLLFIFSGDNLELLKSIFFDDLSRDALHEKFAVFRWSDYAMIVVMAALQVVCAVLPAEPVQVLSGVAFGFPAGLLCCMLGVFIGSTFIFLIQKLFGDKLRSFFIKKLHLDLEKISRSRKCVLIIFILYFLPAIPYGMICFFSASIGMSYRRYIVVTLLGALPSVCIGVGLGYLAVASSWMIAAGIFAVLVLVLVIMGLKRKALFAKVNRYADDQCTEEKL